jgi:hypothetical protein
MRDFFVRNLPELLVAAGGLSSFFSVCNALLTIGQEPNYSLFGLSAGVVALIVGAVAYNHKLSK